MFKIPSWVIVIIALNVAAVAVLLRPNPNVGVPSLNLPDSNESQNQTTLNQSSAQSSNQTLNQSSNQTSNQTFNASYYTLKCVDSISNYIKTVENITNFTNIETRFFNDTDDSINYVMNWSSSSFELMGTGKDIYGLSTSAVSVNDFKTSDGKNFTLPIVCDEYGKIGNYSSCILANISNVTSYCHNLVESISECDIEKANHDFWEDINYWITPRPGPLNETQLFNFTITSSRNRLEYASLFIYYKRPPDIDQLLFNESQATATGDRIEITTTLDLTGKIYGGLIVETWFKKKCYTYGLLDQYLY